MGGQLLQVDATQRFVDPNGPLPKKKRNKSSGGSNCFVINLSQQDNNKKDIKRQAGIKQHKMQATTKPKTVKQPPSV